MRRSPMGLTSATLEKAAMLASLVLVSIVINACGREEVYSRTSAFSQAFFLNNLDELVRITGEKPAVEPANIPPRDAVLRTIIVRAEIQASVKSDAVNGFAYSNENWFVRFSRPSASGGGVSSSKVFGQKGDTSKIKVLVDPFVSPGATSTVLQDVTSGPIELELVLDETDWEEIYDLSTEETSSERRRVQVGLIYSTNETLSSDQNSANTISLFESGAPVLYMQNDIGLIKEPATFRVVGSSSGELTLEIDGPETLTAIEPAQDYKDSDSPSILSGYLVMYWRDGDCNESNWIFQSNPEYRTEAARDLPDPSFACTYGNFDDRATGSGVCQLGCSLEGSEDFYKRSVDLISPEETAIPIDGASCYKTARLPAGRKTLALTGLKNNSKYGIVVWPLDSSGSPGATRSSCLQAVPIRIPLASGESGDVGETVEDCFVATAASGGKASLAVHYWRVLRDRWLDDLGISELYYRYGPHAAHWLRAHPEWKSAVNAVLEWSGAFFVSVDRMWLQTRDFVSEVWRRLKVQWESEAHAKDLGISPEDAPDDGLPPRKSLPDDQRLEEDMASTEPTKRLPLPEEIEAQEGLGPSKTLSDIPERIDGELPPNKAIPEVSEETFSEDRTASAWPAGSARAALRIGGGILMMADERLSETYYPGSQQKRAAFQQTFRLFDAAGEFGLGIAASYSFNSGKVPKETSEGAPISEEAVGRKISYYSTGIYLATDYRWRWTSTPFLAPRFFLNVGYERLRETPEREVATDASAGDKTGRAGYTLHKPMVHFGLAGELSFAAIFGVGFHDAVLGYGAEDLLLACEALYALDLSGHSFSQTGFLPTLSVVLLLD